MSPRAVAIAQTLAVLLLSTLAGVLAKLALRDVPPFTFVWLQLAFGVGLLTLYTFGIRRERIPSGLGRGAWIHIVWIGLGNYAAVRLLMMLSLERLPATTHAYLLSYVGIVTMAMSALLLRERASVLQLAGAVLAVAGLRVFFREIPPASETLGVVYLAVLVLVLASVNNVVRSLSMRTGDRLSNDVLSTLAAWIGGIPVVVAGLVLDWPPPVASVTNGLIIAMNGAVAIAIVLTVFNHVLRTLRSYEASLLASCGVIYTALFAYPILGERLVLHQILGVAMMIVGLVMSQLRRPVLLRLERFDGRR